MLELVFDACLAIEIILKCIEKSTFCEGDNDFFCLTLAYKEMILLIFSPLSNRSYSVTQVVENTAQISKQWGE